jgi:3-dehydroquinate synthase
MLEIQSKFHNYNVNLIKNLEDSLNLICENEQIFTLIDSNVFKLYKQSLEKIITNYPLIVIEANEEQKSFEKLTPIFLKLIEMGFKKSYTLLVIGGGVVQDIGCFISSVLFRGVKWILIPTTLLAQCDSCIGSKSSINIGTYKNQIGTFYPPYKIFLDFEFLKTLSNDEILSGLGEIIKLNLLSEPAKFEIMKKNISKISLEPDAIKDLVIDALIIKKNYIEQDEFDKGIRNILNYGHTFGHAYESATNYRIPHGISVTLGMLTATFFSWKLDMVNEKYFNELMIFLKPYHEPFDKEIKQSSLDSILKGIKSDKKNSAKGYINCILTRGTGKMEKISISLEEKVKPLLDEFITNII